MAVLCKEQDAICRKSRPIEGIVQVINFDRKSPHNSIISVCHVKRVFSLGSFGLPMLSSVE
jgi:hypothetical protein